MCIVNGWTHEQVFLSEATVPSVTLSLHRPLESTSFTFAWNTSSSQHGVPANASQEVANLCRGHVGNPPEALGFLETRKTCMLLPLANTASPVVMLPLTQPLQKGHGAASYIVIRKYFNEKWDAHCMLGLLISFSLSLWTVNLGKVLEWLKMTECSFLPVIQPELEHLTRQALYHQASLTLNFPLYRFTSQADVLLANE